MKFKDNHERRLLGTPPRFSRTKIIYDNHHVQNFMKKAVGVIFFVPHGSSKAIDYIMFAGRSVYCYRNLSLPLTENCVKNEDKK